MPSSTRSVRSKPQATLLVALALAGVARGQGAPADDRSATWNLPPIVPRPRFMDARPVIPDILLKDKRESWYVTGFPAIGYDDEEGFVLGANLQLYDNGARDDPFFRTTSFRQRFTIAAIGTSEGVYRAVAEIDVPYVRDTDWRMRIGTGVVINPLNNYFGRGDSVMGPLRFPGAPGREFDDFGEYQDARDQVVGGRTYRRYDRWESRELPFGVSFEKDMLGGVLRPSFGLRFARVEVSDYSGRVIDGAIQETTRLREDADAGRISGFDGGWNNYLKLGLTYDTRDFERDPTDGVLLQTTAELGAGLLGSSEDYQLVTTSAAGFWSPLGEDARVVLAGRALYSMQFGEVPFYTQGTLASNGFDASGLGGYRALRGFKRERFVGDSTVMANGEVRWSFTEFYVGEQHLRLVLAGFGETGRVHDGVRLEFADWRTAVGSGLRLVWNLSTVVSFDYAVSSEDRIFYLELGQPF